MTSGHFAIRESSHLKRSPCHSALMGCTSLQVTQEGNQNIANAIPYSSCLLVFSHHFSEPAYLNEKGSQYFALYHLQFSTNSNPTKSLPKSYPLYIKWGKTFCAVKESKHGLKIQARPTLQVFASTAMSVTNLMEHDLWLCLQRPLQYSYRSKTVTWLIVTLFFFPKEKQA